MQHLAVAGVTSKKKEKRHVDEKLANNLRKKNNEEITKT